MVGIRQAPKLIRYIRKGFYLAKLAVRRRPIIIDQDWIKIELSNSQDRQSMEYILNGKFWHKCDESAFGSHVTLGDTVIDIGANIGFVTVELSRLAGALGTIFAMEPSKKTFKQLLRTLKINQTASVIPINRGCANFEGEGKLYSINSYSGQNTLRTPAPSATDNSESVKLTKLDSMVKELKLDRIDFIKIDVEGYEAEVIKGGRRTIEKYLPKIFFEIHSNYLAQAKQTMQILSNIGYQMDFSEHDLMTLRGPQNVLAVAKHLQN